MQSPTAAPPSPPKKNNKKNKKRKGKNPLLFFLYFGLLSLTWLKYKQGAVGLRIRVYDRIMCFVNCHFAAHTEAVARRNADFDHVYRSMTFTRASTFSNAVAGIPSNLLLCCKLACMVYVFWLAYTNGLPLILSVAVGASSAVQMVRGTNVGIKSQHWYHSYII